MSCLNDAIVYGRALLKERNIENFKSECIIILEHILEKSSAFIFTHPQYELSNTEHTMFVEYINRRCKNEPLQYILGSQEFMGLNFIVNPSVLIPRQDTETLVETILDNLPQRKKIVILDIGTGSGCIAISLAHFIKNSDIIALDISKKALEVARYNAYKNNVSDRVHFLESNLMDGLNKLNYKFDIIVSNPPYIPLDEMKSLSYDVSNFEPHTALYGGVDGLDFYRNIINDSPDFLNPNGLIAFEVGYNEANAVTSLMQDKFKNIKIIKDLNKIDRVVIGKKK